MTRRQRRKLVETARSIRRPPRELARPIERLMQSGHDFEYAEFKVVRWITMGHRTRRRV